MKQIRFLAMALAVLLLFTACGKRAGAKYHGAATMILVSNTGDEAAMYRQEKEQKEQIRQAISKLTSQEVLQALSERVNEQGIPYSAEKLGRMIAVKQVEDSSLFKLEMACDDKTAIRYVLQTYCEFLETDAQTFIPGFDIMTVEDAGVYQ